LFNSFHLVLSNAEVALQTILYDGVGGGHCARRYSH